LEGEFPFVQLVAIFGYHVAIEWRLACKANLGLSCSFYFLGSMKTQTTAVFPEKKVMK